MKNKKGFTLIELIVVMAIIGVVSSIGYSIINKSNKIISENQNTYNSQQSIKLVNKYMSKDLEECKEMNVTGDVSNKTGQYSIHLGTEDGKQINYIVTVYDKGVNRYYDITRESNSSTVELINKQAIDKLDTIAPLEITKSNNIYEVKINHNNNNNDKYYEFKVTSRYGQVVLGEEDTLPPVTLPPDVEEDIIDKIPEIDTGMEGENGFIKFICKDNLANTSIGSSKLNNNGNYTQYAYSSNLYSNSTSFNTSVLLSTNNNNGYCKSSIGDIKNEESCDATQKDYFGKMLINQVNVTVKGDIAFDIIIKMKTTGHLETVYSVNLPREGKYKFPMPQGKDIEIEGVITKANSKSQGEVIITFGAKNNKGF